mmetsp:Transcript_324/g.1066  ORF Transcript_324/g.1066 Transcript_324/m.1066 type:complete len:237 (+) Transcript_324:2413-3123(+)
MRPNVMKSNDTFIIRQVGDELGVARVVFTVCDPIKRLMIYRPLEWLKIRMIYLHIFFAVHFDGLFFGHAYTTIFLWGKDSCRHETVVHFFSTSTIKAPRQTNTSLNCNRRKFLTSVQHVSDCEDVRHVSHLVNCWDLAVFRVHVNSSSSQIKPFSHGHATNSKYHGVENSSKLRAKDSILNRYFYLTIGSLLESNWLGITHEVGPMTLHMTYYHFGDFRVKATKRDRADSNSGVIT